MIGKKKFVAIALNLEDKAFIVYIVLICQDLDIHPFWRAQIALLNLDKALTSVLPKYADFADVFSKNVAAKLLEHTAINDHAINLIEG